VNKKTLAVLLLLAIFAFSVFSITPMALCATDDMTASITQWLPTIISFAMLGMVLGMLKKFGKF